MTTRKKMKFVLTIEDQGVGMQQVETKWDKDGEPTAWEMVEMHSVHFAIRDADNNVLEAVSQTPAGRLQSRLLPSNAELTWLSLGRELLDKHLHASV